MRARAIIATCVPVVLLLAACGGDDDADGGGADVDPVVAGEEFPDDRCEAADLRIEARRRDVSESAAALCDLLVDRGLA